MLHKKKVLLAVSLSREKRCLRSGVNEKARISLLVPPSPTTTVVSYPGSPLLPFVFSILFLLRSAKLPQPEKHSAPSLHGSASPRPLFSSFLPRAGPRACNIPRYVRQNNRLGKRNERTSRVRHRQPERARERRAKMR